MSPKYTPGPWQVNGHAIEQDHGKFKRTTVVGFVEDRDNDDSEANARLIAAAPELLAAATIALSWIQGAVDDGLYIEGPYADRARADAEKVRAAIAKAIGRGGR